MHYGSIYTMADYETEASNVYLNITGAPMSKLQLNGMLAYSMATGEYEQINMPDGSTITIDNGGTPRMTHADYDFTHVHTYTNLDYTVLRVSVGVQYQVMPKVTWLGNFDYADLTDDAGADGTYNVYGDESGSLFFVRTGVRIDF
jgi:hypothetical protein